MRPSDKNKSHYPYEYILVVDGMRCSNCVRRVENALNSVDGFWAKANLEKKSVNVLSKTQAEASFFEKRIGEALDLTGSDKRHVYYFDKEAVGGFSGEKM